MDLKDKSWFYYAVMRLHAAKWATLAAGAVLGGVPWVLMYLVKDGSIGASAAVTAGTFIGLVVGAWLQWWASDR